MSDIKTKAEQLLQRMALQLTEADSDEKAQQLYSELQNLYSENEDDFIVEPDLCSSLSKSYEELLENLYNPEKNFVYSTGIKSLDQLVGGFLPGETVVIGSRPGMGRTTLALGFFKNFVINQNVPSLFVSYEFSRANIVKRLAAMQINIGTENMDKNKLNNEELINLEKEYNVFKETQGYVESVSFDLNKLKKLLYYYIESKGVKVVFIDAIQHVSTAIKRLKTREREISVIMNELHDIAKNKNVLFIINSFLSRSVETRGGTKRPQLSDLSDSGALENVPEKIVFIHRPEYYGFDTDEMGNPLTGIAELLVAKNRYGKTGEALARFDKTIPAFTGLEEFDKKNFGDVNFDLLS